MIKKVPAASNSGSAWVWGVGLAAVVIAVGSYLMINQSSQPTPEELEALLPQAAPVEEAALEDEPVTTPVPAPSANDVRETEDSTSEEEGATEQVGSAEAAEDDLASAQADDAQEAEEAAAPAIDEVRLAADGVAVVAGRAEPGATVEVIVDGDVVATAEADSGGAFAAIGIVEADDAARVLSLRSVQGDEEIASTDEVILAPVAIPKPKAAPAVQDQQTTNQTVADSDTSAKQSNPVTALAEEPSSPERDGTSDLSDRDSPAVAESSQEENKTADAQEQVSGPIAQIEAPEVPDQTIDQVDDQQAPQIALLKSDAQGVTLLQTAPEPPARIQLDTIGYADSGAVQLAGRAGSQAVEVRVYVNNRVAATLPVAPDRNWRGEVPDIDAGVYTLRVDAVDEQGTVTSRIETPFKREAPAVLAAASAQANGPATAVTVQRGDTLWAIARDRYGEGLLYVQVFEANRTSIRNPDLIYPGQIFALPPD